MGIGEALKRRFTRHEAEEETGYTTPVERVKDRAEMAYYTARRTVDPVAEEKRRTLEAKIEARQEPRRQYQLDKRRKAVERQTEENVVLAREAVAAQQRKSAAMALRKAKPDRFGRYHEEKAEEAEKAQQAEKAALETAKAQADLAKTNAQIAKLQRDRLAGKPPRQTRPPISESLGWSLGFGGMADIDMYGSPRGQNTGTGYRNGYKYTYKPASVDAFGRPRTRGQNGNGGLGDLAMLGQSWFGRVLGTGAGSNDYGRGNGNGYGHGNGKNGNGGLGALDGFRMRSNGNGGKAAKSNLDALDGFRLGSKNDKITKRKRPGMLDDLF